MLWLALLILGPAAQLTHRSIQVQAAVPQKSLPAQFLLVQPKPVTLLSVSIRSSRSELRAEGLTLIFPQMERRHQRRYRKQRRGRF